MIVQKHNLKRDKVFFLKWFKAGLEELVAGNTTKKHWWPENSLFFTGGSRDPKNIWWPTRSSLVAPGFFSGIVGESDYH